jgi:hypothetical protein
MIKQSKRTVTNEVIDTVYFCDRCGKEAKGSTYRRALHECEICGRQVCRDCRIGTGSFDHEYYGGDYPSYRFCHICWDVGEPYRARMHKVCEKAELERDGIIEEWKGELKNDT